MNTENYDKVLAQIEAHPEQFDQNNWHCESTHCFFGWAQILSGQPANDVTVRRDARIFLDIDGGLADWLSSASRTLDDFKMFRDTDRAGFDRAGFDRAGRDRDGFDRAGFDRAGRDRAGFDRAGFDRAGFDRAGRDRAGFDRDGRDVNNKPKP